MGTPDKADWVCYAGSVSADLGFTYDERVVVVELVLEGSLFGSWFQVLRMALLG